MRLERAALLKGDKAFQLFAVLLVAVTLSDLALTAFGMRVLSEVRSYVAGEGRWSKGEKEAVYKLRLYAESRDEREYQQFLAALEAPLGDRRARLELQKPSFDEASAREGFIAGGNDPNDVPGMIWLFRSFGRFEPLAHVIGIWEQGDGQIAALEAAGARVHRAVLALPPDEAGLRDALRDIDRINARATQLENDFSQSLGEAARSVTRLLLRLTTLVAILVALFAGLLARAFLQRLRRGEEARRQSEQVYKSLVEQSPFGIYRSTPDGRFVTANPALVAMLGYASEQELLTKNLESDIYLDKNERTRLIASHVQGGEVTAESAWRRKDGSAISVRQTSHALFDAAGAPEHFSTIVEDVTERRSLEAQLRQSQKMEAIGLLASGVAHDFNNLLTAILGSSELLLEELPEGSQSREDADEIRGAALTAAQLTRQLLAFGRKQALAPRLIDLNQLVTGMEILLRRTLGEELALRCVLAPALGAVQADPGQLQQVILNLAVNARDAMAGGGKLTVETANVLLDEAYLAGHPAVQPGQYVRLAVTDTGSGMDAAVRARVFEPFFTTKPRDKGTGLGLATVFGIVTQSGGYVWAYSEPGLGSVFKVYLPRVEGEPERPKAPVVHDDRRLDGTETLLVAEDQEEVRKTTRKLLEARGYTVLAASGGAEALELAALHAGEIHGLVTDVIMPGINGRLLAQELAKTRPRTKVLYVSGYADESIVRQGVLEAGVAFLEKPFTAEALARKVRELLDDAGPARA